MTKLRRRDALRLLTTLPAASATWPSAARAEDSLEGYLNDDYVRHRNQQQDPSVQLATELERLLPGACMQWLVPPNRLLSSDGAMTWHYLLGSSYAFASTLAPARRLAAGEVEKLARAHPGALCDPSDEWFAHRVAHAVGHKTKVLAFPARPKARPGMSRGAIPVSVSSRDFPVDPAPHVRSTCLLGADRRYRIGLYAAYDKASRELRKYSVTLYDERWQLLGREDSVHAPEDGWCDGCAVPRFADGLTAVFGTYNLLVLEGLPYPLIVSDKSTIESRTIELATFLVGGLYARFGLTQLFMGCPSLQYLVEAANGRDTPP